MFLKSVDASDMVKNAHLLFQLLDEVVEEVGVANVVQIIIDNASKYVLVGKILEAKYCRACQKHNKIYLQSLMDFELDEETHRGQGYC